MVDAPDPVWIYNNITYTITATNAGPATALNVAVTDTLPPGVSVISATPVGYTLSGSLLTFTNLGNLSLNGQAVATIVVKPLTSGTLTNTAVVASAVNDPLKGNNSASVKTVVDLLQLGIVKSGGSLMITWPTNTPGYVLKSATNLNVPVIWTTVTSPSPVVINGQYVLTISVGSGSQYFRLQGP